MPLNRLYYSLLLLIKERGFPDHTLFISLLIKDRGNGAFQFIYLSYLYLNKNGGFGVATCIPNSVPILYHTYKHLSTDLNTYFKIIYNYFILYS